MALTQDKQDKLKIILDHSNDAVLYIGLNHEFLYSNIAAHQLFSKYFNVEFQTGFDLSSFLMQEELSTLKNSIAKTFGGEISCFDLELERSNGIKDWFQFSIKPIKENEDLISGVLLSIGNINERKKNELALKNLTDKYSYAFENTSESIVLMTPEFKVLLFNKMAAERLKRGTGNDIEVGSDFRGFLYKGVEEAFYKQFNIAVSGEENSVDVESAAGGNVVWFRSRMNPVFGPKGNVIALSLVTTHVTPQKVAENKLRRSEEKFRKLIETASNPILILNMDLEIVLINSETSRLFTYSSDELYGRSILSLISDKSNDLFIKLDRFRKADQRPGGINVRKQVVALNKAGEEIIIEAGFNSAVIGDEKFIFVIIQDLTQRVLSEQKLQKANLQLSLLNTVNDIILSTFDEDLLMSELCKVLVEIGGYKLAWIYSSNENKTDQKANVISFGALEYLMSIEHKIKDDYDRSDGVFKSLKLGKTVVLTKEMDFDGYFNWQENAQKFGMRSAIALPINCNAQLVGILTIYSEYDDAFDEFAIVLLERLASNFSRAVENIRIAKEKEAARRELNERVKELKTIYAMTQLLQNDSAPIKNVLENIVQLIPNGWQHPEICSARVLFDGEEIRTKNYSDSEFRQNVSFNLIDGKSGKIEVVYSERPGSEKGDVFLWEEYQLLNNIANKFSEYYNRRSISENLELAESQKKLISDSVLQLKEAQEKLLKAKEVAENANKYKSEFLANVSHEIRTPLNSVLGFSELLKINNKDPKAEKFINGILTGGKNLLSLINDVLDLSKIEAGQMQMQYTVVNIRSLVYEFKQVFSHICDEKGLHFKITIEGENIPKYLLLDETRIRQILFNLLGNAFKFTDKGTVHLSVLFPKTSRTSSAVNLLFRVKDTGIGIPKNQQTKIFDAFKQQDGQSNRKYGGTGLGLTITKHLVDLMGGKIDLEGEVGVGSIFSVFIPNIEIPQTKEILYDTGANLNYQFADQTILLVEDIELNREVFKGFLEGTGLTIVEAVNGQEAIEKMRDLEPDLVLMDLMMPVVDGFEATRAIRTMDKFKTLPVLALSAALVNLEERDSHLFNELISKPLGRSRLLTVLSKYLVNTNKLSVSKFEPKTDTVILNGYEATLDKDQLIKHFYASWCEIKATMSLDDISEFSNALEEYANRVNSKALLAYSKKLNLHASGFEIEEAYSCFLDFNVWIS